jgi:hypothetical protein
MDKFDLDTVRYNAICKANMRYSEIINTVHDQLAKNKCATLKEACVFADIKYYQFQKAKTILAKNLAFIDEYNKKYTSIMRHH